MNRLFLFATWFFCRYHRRSLVETDVMQLKTIFGDKLDARRDAGQQSELRLRCRALNRLPAYMVKQNRNFVTYVDGFIHTPLQVSKSVRSKPQEIQSTEIKTAICWNDH